MPLYDYRVAKKVLSESEKDRMLSVFLNTTNVSFPLPPPPHSQN